MYRPISSLFLGLILTLLGPGISEAELWVCTQPDGSSLYTDQPVSKSACERYEPVSELVYTPPIVRENLPPPPAMTDNKQVAQELVAQPYSSDEEIAPSEASGYNSQLGYQGGFSYEYPGNIEIYNYLVNERRRHDFRHHTPVQHDGAASTPPAYSHQGSSGPVVPTAPASFPGFTQEIQRP
jgi:hypothetical protein